MLILVCDLIKFLLLENLSHKLPPRQGYHFNTPIIKTRLYGLILKFNLIFNSENFDTIFRLDQYMLEE